MIEKTQFAYDVAEMNDRMGLPPIEEVAKEVPRLYLSMPIDDMSKKVAELLCASDGRWEIFKREDEIVAIDPANGRLRGMSAGWFTTWLPTVRGVLPYTKMVKVENPDTAEEEQKPVKGSLSDKICARILESSALRQVLPELETINKIQMPVLDRDEDGNVVGLRLLEEGYDARSKTLTKCEFEYDLEVDPLDALEYLTSEFKHFSYRDYNRDWPIHLASMLSLYCRGMFVGKAPMMVYNANMQGSGKSILASYAVWLVHGSKKMKPFLKDNESKFAEVLNSEAKSKSPYMLLDNVRWGDDVIESASLELFISGSELDFRQFNTQSLIAPKLVTQVLMTGNNLKLSPDLERRSLILDLWNPLPTTERKLPQGVEEIGDRFFAKLENRKRGLTALWSLVKAWDDAGRPLMPRAHKDSFDGWAEVIPSIVWFAGKQCKAEWNCLAAPTNEHIGDSKSREYHKLASLAIEKYGKHETGTMKPVFEVLVKEFASLCRMNGLMSECLYPEADIESVFQTEGRHDGWKFIEPPKAEFNPEAPEGDENLRIQQASEWLSARSRSRFGKALGKALHDKQFKGPDGVLYQFSMKLQVTPARYLVEQKK